MGLFVLLLHLFASKHYQSLRNIFPSCVSSDDWEQAIFLCSVRLENDFVSRNALHHHGLCICFSQAIQCVVACLEDPSFDVRNCALRNLVRISGTSDSLVICEIVKMLSSKQCHCRWAAAEALMMMHVRGDRELLCAILIAIDNPDR